MASEIPSLPENLANALLELADAFNTMGKQTSGHAMRRAADKRLLPVRAAGC